MKNWISILLVCCVTSSLVKAEDSNQVSLKQWETQKDSLDDKEIARINKIKQQCYGSRAYKVYKIEPEIKFLNDLIADVENEIQQEKRVGKQLGYINKNQLYKLQRALNELNDLLDERYTLYRAAGGSLSVSQIKQTANPCTIEMFVGKEIHNKRQSEIGTSKEWARKQADVIKQLENKRNTDKRYQKKTNHRMQALEEAQRRKEKMIKIEKEAAERMRR